MQKGELTECRARPCVTLTAQGDTRGCGMQLLYGAPSNSPTQSAPTHLSVPGCPLPTSMNPTPTAVGMVSSASGPGPAAGQQQQQRSAAVSGGTHSMHVCRCASARNKRTTARYFCTRDSTMPSGWATLVIRD